MCGGGEPAREGLAGGLSLYEEGSGGSYRPDKRRGPLWPVILDERTGKPYRRPAHQTRFGTWTHGPGR